MIKESMTLINETGLHARPANLFVTTAQKFKSTIVIEKDATKINGKSMIELLTLGLTKGTSIVISVDGEDEKEAIQELSSLVNSGFGE
jgi:phosphocarrier protein